MALLIVAALVWVGVHVGIAGTRLRDAAVAKIGEGRFRGLFCWFRFSRWAVVRQPRLVCADRRVAVMLVRSYCSLPRSVTAALP